MYKIKLQRMISRYPREGGKGIAQYGAFPILSLIPSLASPRSPGFGRARPTEPGMGRVVY